MPVYLGAKMRTLSELEKNIVSVRTDLTWCSNVIIVLQWHRHWKRGTIYLTTNLLSKHSNHPHTFACSLNKLAGFA